MVPKLRLVLAVMVWAPGALAQATPPPDVGADLSAASAASPRPTECAPEGPVGESRSAWDGARRPRLRAYCDALARGYAELFRAPARAAASAARARELSPGSVAPLVLEARALVGSGREKEAWPVFLRARSLDKASLGEPAALHDFALAALASGEHAEAVAAYRALVPRAALLADPRRRQRVYLEAAMTVLRQEAATLDEALGYLGEARRLRGLPGLSDVVLGATALTLDRQGRSEEARGVAAEARGALGVAKLAGARDRERVVALPEGELSAVAAMLAERAHPELARKLWRVFVESPDSARSPWLAHAKKKAEGALGVGRRPRKPR